MTKGRKPDYRVWAAHPDESNRGAVGGAWINEDGSISIKLDPFIVITAVHGLTIKLFPEDGKFEERASKAIRKKSSLAAVPDSMDDIPF